MDVPVMVLTFDRQWIKESMNKKSTYDFLEKDEVRVRARLLSLISFTFALNTNLKWLMPVWRLSNFVGGLRLLSSLYMATGNEWGKGNLRASGRNPESFLWKIWIRGILPFPDLASEIAMLRGNDTKQTTTRKTYFTKGAMTELWQKVGNARFIY